jgi:uncharacterized protein (DUF58 family)
MRRALLVSLIVVGVVAGAPGPVIVAVLALLADGLSVLWSTRGLRRVSYQRRLARDRAVWGDEVALEVGAHNDKLLPLAWLRVDDYVTDTLNVPGETLLSSERPGLAILRHAWSMAPFERVTRRLHIVADRRGVFDFGPVREAVADVFGHASAVAEEAAPARLLVRPRTVPVRTVREAPVVFGSLRARRLLAEDPTLFAGVRPFQPGDPRRRIHARATARTGTAVSKKFDPSIVRQVVIALDVQTIEGSHWLLHFDEETVEGLMVVAASLSRAALADGAACGLAANGWTHSLSRLGWLPPQAGSGQLVRLADMLGRLSSTPSMPFERLLAELPGRLPGGGQLVVLSARDPTPLVLMLRRLGSIGHEVRVLSFGHAAAGHAARLRRLGLDAAVARLEPDWRTAPALAVA